MPSFAPPFPITFAIRSFSHFHNLPVSWLRYLSNHILFLFPIPNVMKGFPDSSVGKKCKRPRFNSWVGKICCRRGRLPTLVFLGFPCGSGGKESTCNVGDLASIPGLGRSPGEGKGYPLQYSGMENSMDCRVHGVTKSWTRLSEFHHHSSSGILCLPGGQKLQKNHPAVFTTCFQYL